MTDLDAALNAIVARGNGYSTALARPDGPAVRFESARAERSADGGEGVVVAFTYVDPSGREQPLEYRLAPDDSLLRELADGEEGPEGFATIVAVTIWEEVETTGVEGAVRNGTFQPRRA